MSENMEHGTDNAKAAGQQGHLGRRDAETQIALGLFITVIVAIPVLIGTFWADRAAAAVINVIAGLVLLGVGVGLGLFGWWKLGKLPKQS